MKILLSFLSLILIASTSFAGTGLDTRVRSKIHPEVIAWVYIVNTVPGSPQKKLKIYANATAKKWSCPMSPNAKCQIEDSLKISGHQLEIVQTLAEAAVLGTVMLPPPPGIKCQAISTQTWTYYVHTNGGAEDDTTDLAIAERNPPCGQPMYRNADAQHLADFMDAIFAPPRN